MDAITSLLMDWEQMIQQAMSARERAHAPYSGYRVGAALLFDDGTIVGGCNVENRLPTLSVCAERVAMTRAVAEGQMQPVALLVMTASRPPAAPCGLCLETLSEFVEDLPILLVNEDGEAEETTLRTLLPRRFTLPSH